MVYNHLEYSSLNLCNLIGQLQVSKSHRDLQKRSLFNRDLSLRAFSLRDSIENLHVNNQ